MLKIEFSKNRIQTSAFEQFICQNKNIFKTKTCSNLHFRQQRTMASIEIQKYSTVRWIVELSGVSVVNTIPVTSRLYTDLLTSHSADDIYDMLTGFCINVDYQTCVRIHSLAHTYLFSNTELGVPAMKALSYAEFYNCVIQSGIDAREAKTIAHKLYVSITPYNFHRLISNPDLFTSELYPIINNGYIRASYTLFYPLYANVVAAFH